MRLAEKVCQIDVLSELNQFVVGSNVRGIFGASGRKGWTAPR